MGFIAQAATLLLPLIGIVHGAPDAAACRCTSQQPCWPSTAEWRGLNDSIAGELVAVKPIGSVCHDPTFDKDACAKLTAINTNSVLRSGEPGALLSVNWETWPEKHQSCYVGGKQNEPCEQGRISRYSAVVHTPQDIQHAVRFADKHDLRLVVKNTGHDYLGRSAAPESLQILTHFMKDIDFTDDFVPEGKGKGKGIGQAVTIGAGVQLAELYRAAGKRGKTQVIGLSITVGAAGGYIQAGGHSPLGPWKGMPTDHVLEYKVVTAKGEFVTANEYQNQDLFWALRGGGGGTFGVVTSVTLRTFEDAPLVGVNFNISLPTTANESYWKAIEKFQAHLPALSEGGGSGYYYVIPDLDFEGQSISLLTGVLFFADQSETKQVDKLLEPLDSELKRLPGIITQFKSTAAPSSEAAFEPTISAEPSDGGVLSVLGSRLLSAELFRSKDGPAKITKAISQLRTKPGDVVIGHLVAGGQIAKNKDIDTAVNPAWRKALVHLAISRSWDINTTFEEQRTIQSNLTNVEVPLFDALEPGISAAYINEGDVNEPEFQQTFWGSNYPKLLRIKKARDPKGLFFVRSGVGSEGWDEQGLCRV